ncbi:MAG TPA: hypothetical protein VHE35_10855 [Kofleriaceae bacterium]|nr:hypothetical protein [Kofleriaceae bacterium]
MPELPAALPHGPIEEVFQDVFVVRGRVKPGPGIYFDRNMAIVRRGGELVAINSVRLSDAGEAELARLGKLTHVLRIGAGHGMDDPYYVDRFAATLWGPPGMPHEVPGARILSDTDKPLDGEVFTFTHGRRPEACVILPIAGGVLVSCDSYQNWTTFEHCSLLAGPFARLMGFGPAVVGRPWAKKMGPDVRRDLEALAEKAFVHLVPGHGSVLRDEARTHLPGAIRRRFGAA